MSSTGRRSPALSCLVPEGDGGPCGRRWRNGRLQRSVLIPDAANLSASATSSGALQLPPAPWVSTSKPASVFAAHVETREQALHPACHRRTPRPHASSQWNTHGQYHPSSPAFEETGWGKRYRPSFLASHATTTFVGSMASESSCISITLPPLSIR